MSPELRREGLAGKTIAVGPVVCAKWEYDPTIGEAAVLQLETEKQLRRLRPTTSVVDFVALERIAGTMKTRISPSKDLLQSRVVPKQQWSRMAEKGISYLLLAEVVYNKVSQTYGSRTDRETKEEKDANGKTRTCTTEHHYSTANACRFTTVRLHLIDVQSQSTVWQARSEGQDCNKNEKAISYLDNTPPTMPDPPRMSDIVEKLLAKPLRRLPK